MLKIKDNVDLKELEKYGFEYKKEDNYYQYWCVGYDEICIEEENKEIQLGYEPSPEFIENILYDLIKADLVEKVDE